MSKVYRDVYYGIYYSWVGGKLKQIGATWDRLFLQVAFFFTKAI